MFVDPPLPPFEDINTVLTKVREVPKPVHIILLGTNWSPPCRYTFQALQEVMKDPKIQETTVAYYVDQDADQSFCHDENIPIGFPTTIVFSSKNPKFGDPQDDDVFLLNFSPQGMQDKNDEEMQKNRLIRQLSSEQFIDIINETIRIYEGQPGNLTIPE